MQLLISAQAIQPITEPSNTQAHGKLIFLTLDADVLEHYFEPD